MCVLEEVSWVLRCVVQTAILIVEVVVVVCVVCVVVERVAFILGHCIREVVVVVSPR